MHHRLACGVLGLLILSALVEGYATIKKRHEVTLDSKFLKESHAAHHRARRSGDMEHTINFNITDTMHCRLAHSPPELDKKFFADARTEHGPVSITLDTTIWYRGTIDGQCLDYMLAGFSAMNHGLVVE